MADSSNVAAQIVTCIDELVGEGKWEGDKPFVIDMVDASSKRYGAKYLIGYKYELRRGEDWATICETCSENPMLVKTFQLQLKNGKWKYLDGRLIKYKESSMPELQAAFERLKIAIELSKPKSVEGKPRHLLSDGGQAIMTILIPAAYLSVLAQYAKY